MALPETSGTRILIVDDTPGNVKILSMMLNRQSYQVYTSNSGAEALTLAQEIVPDLILLDIMMPGMNGYDVCLQLKQNPLTRDIPVIFISALNDTTDKLKAFKIGGVDYITKPFQVQEVLARVKTHLMIRTLQRQLQQTNNVLERRVEQRTQELLRLNVDLKQQINERERIEETLRKSEETYRTFFEDSKDAVFITTPDGKIVDMNSAGLNMFGYTPEEVALVNAFRAHMSKTDRRRFIQTIEEQGAVKDFEIQLTHRDGSKMDCLITATLRQQDDGTILGYQGIIRDITQHKQAERQRLLLISIQRDLGIAQEIQESLLPPPDPEWPDLQVICHTTPAREMGGDLYAYHDFSQDVTHPQQTNGTGLNLPKYALAVGDVSGKGMPAALLMAVSLASFRSIVRQSLHPQDFLLRMDSVLCDYTRRTRQNCALAYVDITPPTNDLDEGMLRVANAGCVMPLIKQTDGTVAWINIGGMPLGTGLGSQDGYAEVSQTIVKGDMIILTSDGVIEANNSLKEMFGFERLEQAVREGPQYEAEELLEYLLDEIQNFVGYTEPHDDITIMVIKV